MTLRLAVLQQDQVDLYAQDPDSSRAWALSEVAVARYRIATCPPPVGMDAAAEAARASWGRWERDSPVVQLALLVPEGARYRLAARSGAGQDLMVLYDKQGGLAWF